MRRANEILATVVNQGLELIPVVETDVPLVIGASFESGPFGVVGYARIVGSVRSDREGTIFVEQSQDGANWDYQSEFLIPADDPASSGFMVEVVALTARIRFVNGALDQTWFRLVARRRYS